MRKAFQPVEVLFLLTPLLFSFIYSYFSFNPTDEGFILAYSRRLIEGEVPHRDFISIRPVLSALLHLPELFAADYSLYLPRAVAWLEVSISIYLVWVILGIRRVLWGLLPIALMLSAFYYPLMAWHTIDGIFLSLLGVYVLCRGGGLIWVGILLGLAALCKQNFLLVGPLVFLLFQIHTRKTVWLGWLIPFLLYGSMLLTTGAFGHFMQQMLGETSIIDTGVLAYFGAVSFWAGLVVAVFTLKVFRGRSTWVLMGLAGIVFTCFLFILIGSFEVHPPKLLFGLLLGTLLFMPKSKFRRVGGAILIVAWVASISIGLNSPALVSGGMFLAIFKLWDEYFSFRVTNVQLAVFAILCFVPFHFGRINNPYRDLEHHQLNIPLGSMLKGGSGIYTNANTAALLAEADSIARSTELPVAFVPLLPAFYIHSEEPNPLPIDWARGIEIAAPAVFDQLTKAALMKKGTYVIALQKYRTASIAIEKAPVDLDSPDQKFAKWVTENFTAYAETDLHVLYK